MNKSKFEFLYSIVMSQNQLKYKQKHPRTFTGKTCSPLLCYRFVSTTLAAQIPSGNAIAKPPALLHAFVLSQS